ncbi:MAG TPA: hypothetical protein VG347_16415 [Verrucomicrobiae bacterium]|nr:hypothetical protein [Verrucomicrobiae bacterium]
MPDGDSIDGPAEVRSLNECEEGKLVSWFDGGAKKIADFLDSQEDSKQLWDQLLAGGIIAFHVKSLDSSRLNTNFVDPFERANDFFLHYNPEEGFFVACEFKGKPLAVGFTIQNDGKIVDYSDQFRVTDRKQFSVSPEIFQVKNSETISDIQAHVDKEAASLIEKLVRLGVPEDKIQKTNPPRLG